MVRILLIFSLIFIVSCSKDKDIIDIKENCIAEDPKIDYSRPSVFNTSPLFHYGYPLEQPWGWPMDIAIIDYNRDGFLDAVTSNSDYTHSFNSSEQKRRKILFYKSDCFGNLTLDTEYNSQGWEGLVHARKSIVGDFNQDTYPDIVFVGHGLDNDQASIYGEYPIVLMSTETGYEYKTYPNIEGYWHGGSAGDLDNDGDLDILLPPSTVMVNNNGEFTEGFLNFEVTDQAGALEIIDIDGDGVLEIVYGSSDFADFQESWIGTTAGKIAPFPVPENYGIVVDLDFIDLDEDGVKEIIVNRVGSPDGWVGNYTGWYLQVLKYTNGQLIDITSSAIDQNYDYYDEWIEWFNVSDIDNDGDLDLYTNTDRYDYRWELVDGKLKRTK